MGFPLSDLVMIAPELILALGALLLLMYGVFRGPRVAVGVTLFTCLFLVCASAKLALPMAEVSYAFNDLLRVDSFTQFTKLLMLIATLLVLILSVEWIARAEHRFIEYPVLVLLSVIGGMVMVSANDLLTLYMGLELSSLALYILASIARDSLNATEAGLKYFVLGALASGMMLFGSSLIYGFSGTTNFTTLAGLFGAEGEASTAVSPGLIVGLVMLMVGFFFKVSAVPFHMWTPDVYQGAPTPVTAFFATVPKIAALALFVRVLFIPFGDIAPYWRDIVVCVSIASMLVGALGAMMQTSLKRLLAYGSIGHVGYNLVGLATGDIEGAKAVLIYMALYLFMAIGAFGFVMLMRRAGESVENIEDLAGLSHNRPRAALFLAITMFSMAGIPPLAGFYGKFYVFLSAIEAEQYALAIIGVLTSVIAAYYYLKIVKIMYFDAPCERTIDRIIPLSAASVLGCSALVSVGFFLSPTFLVRLAENAATALQL